MKQRTAISIIFLLASCIAGSLVLIVPGCNYNAGKTEIHDTAMLRIAMLKSIDAPFAGADTLILSPVRINPGQDTVVYISTQFEQYPYNDSLQKQLGLTVITQQEFVAQMISAPENGHLHCSFSPDILDTCIKNKIAATIWAEKSAATGNILLHETYLLGDSLKSLVKEFSVTPNGSWNYKIKQ